MNAKTFETGNQVVWKPQAELRNDWRHLLGWWQKTEGDGPFEVINVATEPGENGKPTEFLTVKTEKGVIFTFSSTWFAKL